MFFILVRLKQHIRDSLNQASVMFSVVCLKNDGINVCLLKISTDTCWRDYSKRRHSKICMAI